jgi:hypothetical protein
MAVGPAGHPCEDDIAIVKTILGADYTLAMLSRIIVLTHVGEGS